MSVHASHPPETFECGQCGEQFSPPATEGSFCSPKCHDAHRRAKRANEVFNHLKQSHEWCFTCFRRLKVIEKPPQSAPECAIGYQHRTEHAQLGERSPAIDEPDFEAVPSDGDDPIYVYELRGDEYNQGTFRDYRNPPERSLAPDDPVRTGTICTCGNTDHRDANEILRDRFPFQIAHYLAIATAELRSQGKHGVRIDRERLSDAVREQVLPVQDDSGVDIRAAFESAVIVP